MKAIAIINDREGAIAPPLPDDRPLKNLQTDNTAPRTRSAAKPSVSLRDRPPENPQPPNNDRPLVQANPQQ